MTAVPDDDVIRASALLGTHIGLRSDPSFRPRLARALRDVAASHHLDTSELMAGIAVEGPILDDLLDHITVQETAFFRHPEHFRTLADTLLPQFLGPVHVWSAASANGQEPYSIAMVLREQGRIGSILATDVAPTAIRRITKASYGERELRGVSAERLKQHFIPEGGNGHWRVQQAVRDLVVPRHHNLLWPIPAEVAECQVVFCRNVLIYFTAAHATGFLDRLADVMAPNAHLIVGSSETLWHINDRFAPHDLGTCYVFRPRKKGHTAKPPVATARAHDRHPPDRDAIRTPPAAVVPPAKRRALVPVDVAALNDASDGEPTQTPALDANAVVECRRWAYSAPDDPLAHFHLGTALQDAGHPVAARRAFRSALDALDRADPGALDHTFEGYTSAELRRLLVEKCRPAGRDPEVPPVTSGKGRAA